MSMAVWFFIGGLILIVVRLFFMFNDKCWHYMMTTWYWKYCLIHYVWLVLFAICVLGFAISLTLTAAK